jgi:hypothetical protein
MSRRAIDVAWAGIVVAGIVLMLVRPTTTGDSLGLRRSVTPEINEQWHVGQRFRMNLNGLSGVEILPTKVGDVSGMYRLSLRALTDDKVERHADIEAGDLARRDSYLFQFDPIPFSADVPFQLDVAPVPGNPGRGVALRVTKGERLREGGLLINGTPRWASLAFDTSTSSTAVLPALLGGAYGGSRPAVLIALAVWLVTLRFGLQNVAAASRCLSAVSASKGVVSRS